MATGSTPPTSDGFAPFSDRRVITACVLLFAMGWFAGQGRSNPFAPSQPKRPVLAALAKAAKTALWLLVVEPVPDDLPDEHFVVHAHTDRINHREGW